VGKKAEDMCDDYHGAEFEDAVVWDVLSCRLVDRISEDEGCTCL
jgi:hypothetical protein